jgi:hypothetical protein
MEGQSVRGEGLCVRQRGDLHLIGERLIGTEACEHLPSDLCCGEKSLKADRQATARPYNG